MNDCRCRLKDARDDTVELKKQLYTIESQVNDVKSHLHRLQEQKYKLTGELYKQECALNQIITLGGVGMHVDKEDDVSYLPSSLHQVHHSLPSGSIACLPLLVYNIE